MCWQPTYSQAQVHLKWQLQLRLRCVVSFAVSWLVPRTYTLQARSLSRWCIHKSTSFLRVEAVEELVSSFSMLLRALPVWIDRHVCVQCVQCSAYVRMD
jgi:hypothetical protein